MKCLGPFFHDWGKWEDIFVTYTRPCHIDDGCVTPPAKGFHEFSRVEQTRRCSRCGRLQRRRT